ncbi:MAG TPA: glycerate kinase [Candidatus Methylomirabilis sp.]|nr:glycerate kinase [Candidatus Methylomirabilis sp.]
MSYIRNRQTLLAHGNRDLRKVAFDIVDYALTKADPYRAVKALVHLQGDLLEVGNLRLDLKTHGRILLLGAGKATFPIAKALEDILGERIADGVIICKYGQEGTLARSRLYLSSHPIPDEAGFRAARDALALARETRAGDIVFAGITGGSSALMPYPVEGITLDAKKRINQLLLTCGANIIEINAVRKHLSRIKGGWLAKSIHPQAHLINLTVSDVIGDPLDYITCPTVPDTSSFDDARRTLSKYELWEKAPASVSRYLKAGGPGLETPKDLSDHHLDNFIIVAGTAACEGAAEKARELNLQTMILSTMLEGESRELGGTFAAIGKEILLNNRPLQPPCVVIGGGETTVKITGEAGQGGPNQEFSLGAALGIDRIGDVVIIGQDSDGTDGPTDIAGGVVDNLTIQRAQALGIDVFAALTRHDVTPVLLKLEDAIVTGPTGTNVNDLKLMLVLACPR